MNIKKHIPNTITCLNLACGCLGCVAVFQGDLNYASYLIVLACIFDFLDGFVARILKVNSEIGKELDSLADVVTFGLLPGLIIFSLISGSLTADAFTDLGYKRFLPYFAFIITVFSALRLAKFNVDTRQSSSFIGLPVPANALFIASFPLIAPHGSINLYPLFHNTIFLLCMVVLTSYLLVSPVKLLAFKFKDFTLKNNKFKYLFLMLSVGIFLILNFASVPFIIILYIALSMIENHQNNESVFEF